MKESKAFQKHNIETYLRNAGRAYSHSSLNIWHQPKRPNTVWDYIRQLSLSVITDPCNRCKASEHMEPAESARRVAKRGKSYKAREKWRSAGEVIKCGKSDKGQEEWESAEKVRKCGKIYKAWENCQTAGRVTKRGKSDIARKNWQSAGNMTKCRKSDKRRDSGDKRNWGHNQFCVCKRLVEKTTTLF